MVGTECLARQPRIVGQRPLGASLAGRDGVTNENDLRSIYDNLGTTTVMRSEKTEITYLFTAGAIAVSLLAGVLSLFWFNRLP